MNRSRAFPEAAPSVPRARQFVLDALHGVPPEVCETVALLVSELATNAVVHAGSEFEVTVIYPTDSGRIRVEVTDSDLHFPTPLDPPPTVPHGRGLQLVVTLSDAWGMQTSSTRNGKTVWFELALPAAPAPASPRSAKGRAGRRLPPGVSSLSGLRVRPLRRGTAWRLV
jgi:anti-sigma regulatory factor (Ser/Thr protein kinase)